MHQPSHGMMDIPAQPCYTGGCLSNWGCHSSTCWWPVGRPDDQPLASTEADSQPLHVPVALHMYIFNTSNSTSSQNTQHQTTNEIFFQINIDHTTNEIFYPTKMRHNMEIFPNRWFLEWLGIPIPCRCQWPKAAVELQWRNGLEELDMPGSDEPRKGWWVDELCGWVSLKLTAS